MGFRNQNLKHFFAFFLILFAILVVFRSRPASCNEILTKVDTHPNANHAAATNQVMMRIKNNVPFFSNNQEFDNKKRKRQTMMMKRRKINKNKKFRTSRPFSVMLPKGSVPPSGSSQCHNDKPDSAVAHGAHFCGHSSTTPEP